MAGGRFGLSKLGNCQKPTKHAVMQPPAEAGPRLRCLGCERTNGAAAPWLARLATAFARWAGG